MSGVLISYLSIGSGHKVAANAIANSLEKFYPQKYIKVIDLFAKYNDQLPFIMEQLQALSIQVAPALYDAIWRQGAPGNIFDRIVGLQPLRELFLKELTDHRADLLIATHVLPCRIGLEIKRDHQLIKKVIGVVTDYGIHSFWPTQGMDAYFVGHEELRNTLVYKGVDPNIVHVTGIPISLGFAKSQDFNKKSGNKLKILLIAGGVHSGAYINVRQNIKEIIDAIAKFNPNTISLTIITGNQKSLFETLKESIHGYSISINLLGFVDNMAEIMADHDILITKPGGLIVAEALSSGLGIILLKSGPGQELENATFLIRHRVALNGESTENLTKAIQFCLENPNQFNSMRERALNLSYPKAAETISRVILQLVNV